LPFATLQGVLKIRDIIRTVAAHPSDLRGVCKRAWILPFPGKSCISLLQMPSSDPQNPEKDALNGVSDWHASLRSHVREQSFPSGIDVPVLRTKSMHQQEKRSQICAESTALQASQKRMFFWVSNNQLQVHAVALQPRKRRNERIPVFCTMCGNISSNLKTYLMNGSAF